MKKTNLFLLFSIILCFNPMHASNQDSHPLWQHIASINDTPQIPDISFFKNFHEGITENTQVATHDGYIDAKDLSINSTISSEIQDHQKITGIISYDSAQLIEVTCDQLSFTIGKHQKFYVENKSTWVQAYQLEPGDLLETMDQPVQVSSIQPSPNQRCVAISVEDEIYIITKHNILTHNVPAVAAQPIIQMGAIVAVHAAHIFLGVCPSIKDLYNWMLKGNTLQCEPKSFDIELPERSYFLFRYYQLLELKKNYLQIKSDLKLLSGKTDASSLLSSIATQPFQESQLISNLQPSEEDEMHLTWPEERKLNQLREEIICQLENEIARLQHHILCTIQTVLINIEIEYESLEEQLNKYKECSTNAQHLNNFLDPATGIKNSIEFYVCAVAFDIMLQDFKQAAIELELVTKYCNELTNNYLIHQTSNAIAVLNEYSSTCKQFLKSIDDHSQIHEKNKDTCKQRLQQHSKNISIQTDRAIHFAKNKKSDNQNKKKNLINASKAAAPSPQKPDKDDSDDKKTICEKFGHLTGKLANNKIARQVAASLGYAETKSYPFDSHGQLVFRQGNKYISLDKDSHNGGFWKRITKNKNFRERETMNACLTKKIGK